jgi:alkanesulfonate monooxygenase SsuD/methylene tetrahydromethanopterin reductase-like flavin-dependent oxidoreductase (luciferase family)
MTNIGLWLDLRNPPQWRRRWSELYSEALELCEEADRLGAHSVWLSEHHLFPDGYLPQPLTMAAAIAARTRNVRIGTAVLLAPLRPAALIAEEAALVDVLSGGRLELGVGTGYRRPEFDLYAASREGRHDTTDDRVREIRRLWEGGEVLPPPVQKRPRIWMGYQGPRGARRAGLLGESLLSIRPELLDAYQQGLADGGHPVTTACVAGGVSGWVTDDPEADWPVIAARLAYQWNSYLHQATAGAGGEVVKPDPVEPERWRQRGLGPDPGHFLLATPENAAGAIRRFTEGRPIDTLFFWVSLAATPYEMTQRHMRSLVTDLAPRVAADQ